MRKNQMRIRYAISRLAPGGDTILVSMVIGEGKAIRAAHSAATAYPEDHIYVTWLRGRDGCRGYLNPDGNHDPVGRRWTA